MNWQPDRIQKWCLDQVTDMASFENLRTCGMFWEWFPECDGTYKQFMEMKEKYEKDH